MGNTRVAILLFGSGACALAYQTVWLRVFREIFGASTVASAAVLAIFMGGIGLGSWLLGPRADRTENPLRLYAILELIIAGVAALSPFLLDGVRAVYLGLGGVNELGEFSAAAVRLTLASLVLAGAVIPMGGTLPAAARAAMSDSDRERRAAAFVYGANALGSVVGAIVPTFLLFDVFGIRLTLWCMVLINLLIGIVALSQSRQMDAMPAPGASTTGASDDSPSDRSGKDGLLLAAAFATGFVFFLIEIVWYRIAAPILGGSTYTFALILAFALLGIGVGGLTFAIFPIVKPERRHFGVTCAAQGALMLVPYAMGDQLALLALALRDGFGALSFTGTVISWSIVTAILVFPTALVAGYQFPLLIALKGRGKRGLSGDVGRLYAANTLGAITGSIAGGFGFLPLFGATNLWLGCGLGLGIIAILFSMAPLPERRDRWRTASLAPLLVLIACALTTGPSALWRHSAIGAGRMKQTWADANGFKLVRNFENSRVLEEYDGLESSIAFTWPELSLMTSGKSDGSVIGDALTQTMLGSLPAILRPEIRDALVIGLATGQTANALASSPSQPHVLVAELEPAVLRFTELSAPTNGNVLDNPNVEIFIGDGRELTITSKQRFDVIVSEPSNPFRAGLAAFYSVEFFRHVRDKLQPDGLFVQWMQGYEITPQAFQIVLATMGQVFPEISIWSASGNDYILVAATEPQVLDLDRMRSQLRTESFRALLGRVCGVWDVETLLGLHIANPGLAKLLSSDPRIPINTDDRPILEYEFANSLGKLRANIPHTSMRSLAREFGFRRPSIEAGQNIDWSRVERSSHHALGPVGLPSEPPPAFASHPDFAGWSEYARGDLAGASRAVADTPPPGDPSRLSFWLLLQFMSDKDSNAFRDRATATQHSEKAHPNRALQRPRELLDHLRDLGLVAQAKWLEVHQALSEGRSDRATALAVKALAHSRSDPWTWQPILKHALDRIVEKEDWSEGEAQMIIGALIEGPLAGYAAEARRQAALRTMTAHLDDPALCQRVFALNEPYPHWSPSALLRRQDCYKSADHPLQQQAEQDAAQYLAGTSQSIRSLLAQQRSLTDAATQTRELAVR